MYKTSTLFIVFNNRFINYLKGSQAYIEWLTVIEVNREPKLS